MLVRRLAVALAEYDGTVLVDRPHRLADKVLRQRGAPLSAKTNKRAVVDVASLIA